MWTYQYARCIFSFRYVHTSLYFINISINKMHFSLPNVHTSLCYIKGVFFTSLCAYFVMLCDLIYMHRAFSRCIFFFVMSIIHYFMWTLSICKVHFPSRNVHSPLYCVNFIYRFSMVLFSFLYVYISLCYMTFIYM